MRAAEQVGYPQRGRVFVGNFSACRIPAVGPKIGPLVSIQRKRNRRHARRRGQSGNVAVGAKLQVRCVNSALEDVGARPPPRLHRDHLASGNPVQRVGSIPVGLKCDVVGKLNLCGAVVVVIVVEIVTDRVDFGSDVSVWIELWRVVEVPRVQEPAVAVVRHCAHGAIRPEPELSLVGAVGVHRVGGFNAAMDVIDGSAAGAGRTGRGGNTDQSQGGESREFASYSFNRGVKKRDCRFHLFISG